MRPLRCGIFVSIEYQEKVWESFKYETLLNFYFSSGKIRRRAKKCEDIPLKDRMKEEDEIPYSIPLRAKSTMIGKESFKFELLSKKLMKQYNYTSSTDFVDGYRCGDNDD